MSKYKIWTIDNITDEIHKLEKKSNFYLDKDVEIRVNPRLKRSLARCQYKYENELTKIDAFEFNKNLIDGTVCEEEVLDTIIHEFAHAYTDYDKPKDKFQYECEHTKEWKENAIKLGCNGEECYIGDEFTYKKPYNNTLTIRCKECGEIYNICDMVLGHEVEEYYTCTKMIEGKRCKGKFEILQDVATDEKRLKCIKKYITNELTGSRHGELKEYNGVKYRMCHIKNSSIMNLRMSYKNKLFKIQITNKIAKIADEDMIKTYNILIQDVKKYLENKTLFKFIDKLNFEHKGADKYEFSFPLDINNINLVEM